MLLPIHFPEVRLPQIEAGKVFVNGKLITSNGYRLKDNDIISVRKMGRIAYDGILSQKQKKGRYMISLYANTFRTII